MLGIGTKDWPLFTYNVIVKSGQIKMVTTIPSLSLGSQISSNLAATFWTYFCVLTLCILNFSGANQGLLQELGLRVLPDVSKINISLDEYTRMMNLYLQSREESGQDESVPKLVTFKLDRKLVRDNDKYPTVILRFPVDPQVNVELESAELKVLVPPQLENVPSPKVQVNIILSNRRKELIRERTFYLSQEGPKWCTADITSAVQSWLRGDVNLGLELVCLDSNCILDPLEAAVTSLMHTPQSRRVRRESPYEPKHKTTCRDTGTKHRCCRQSMNVTFSELGLEQEQIVRPQVYDAGYCTGMCPPNYLHSYNHTYIQSIMRRRERRNHKAFRKVIPKACCAPLKLSSVSFLVIDPDYPSTMVMRLWENMAVEECGCS